MCEPLTQYPTLEPGLWTVELLSDAYPTAWPGGAYDSRGKSCGACGAEGEEQLYRDEWGAFLCGSCISLCGHCGEARAVVSARRPDSDPSAPGAAEHVCLDCLEAHWDPAETILGAYLCPECDLYHVAEEQCCACHGDGYFERDEETEYGAVAVAQHCDCPAGVRLWEEDEREHAWMIPHVRRSEAARRRGDTEEAERIKHDVLRHDSPHDPVNRRSYV